MLNILLICLPLWVQGDAREVQLTPRVRSLSQLAEELSRQGVRVQCDPLVANRLALVNVQPRPWNSLRPLLEQGLEVRFTRQPEGTWRLAAGAEAASREKTLRDHFVSRYEKSIADALIPAWDAADAMRHMDEAERENKRKELLEIIAQPVAPGATSPEGEVADLTLSLLNSNSTRAGLLPLRRNLSLTALLQAPSLRTTHIPNLAQDNSDIALRMSAWLQSRPYNQPLPATPCVFYDCLRVDLLTFGLSERMYGTIEPKGTFAVSPSFVPGNIHHLNFTLRDVFAEAGQEKTLAASEQATQTWLAQAGANRPIALDMGERTLSATAQKWSVQNGQEVIMEVSPQRDILPGFSAVQPALSLSMARALQSGHPPQEEEATSGDGAAVSSGEAVQNYLNATPDVESTSVDINLRVWTAEQVEGVTLIHNQLAFLDNQAVRNPSAGLLLAQRRTQHDDHLPAFADLLDASRLLSPYDNLLSADSTLYRGLGNYAGVHPYLRLLDQYPRREALLKELAGNRVAYLECRYCSRSALNAFTDSLYYLALLAPPYSNFMRCFDSDFALWVQNGVIQIKTEPLQFGDGVWMTFVLYKSAERNDDPALAQPQVLCQATVGPVHALKPSTANKETAKP
jgi:hypothetical protein